MAKEVLELEIKGNIKDATKDTKDWGKQLEDVNSTLDEQKKILLELKKEEVKLQSARAKMSDWEKNISGVDKKLEHLKFSIKDQTLAVKTLTEEQKQAAKETKNMADAQKEQDKAVKDGIGNFQILGVSLNGLKGSFSKIIPTIRAMFGSIKAGIISTGIGALLIAVGSLIAYFTQTKKGANVLKKAMAGLGAIVSVLMDAFSTLGEAIVAAFRDPLASIDKLWEAIKTNLINRLDGLIAAFGAAGTVIKGILNLDWSAAKKGAEDYAQAIIQIGTGLTPEDQLALLEATKNLAAEMEREAAAMMALEGRLQKLADAENLFTVQKAKTRKEIEAARLASEDESKSAEERVAQLKQALELEKQTTEQELALARERVSVKRAEMKISKNKIEDEEEFANLRAAVFAKESAALRMKARVVRDVNALEKKIADEKAAADKIIADAAEAKIQKAKDEAAILLELQQGNTVALIKDLYERALKELEIQEEKEMKSAELMENAEEVKAAIKEKYDIKRDNAAEEFGKKQVKWSEMTDEERLGIASDTAGSMSKILGEETAAGKAFAVTQATIDTFQGANAAYSSMAKIPYVGPVLGGIAAAAAVASGLANVKAILSAGSGGGGGGGGGGASGGGAGAQTPAPQMMSGAFELSGGEAPEPIKAFVVTDEMTDSQNQLANIRRKATI